MAEAPMTVALLAGDVSRRGEVRRLARLVGRLARHGVSARVFGPGGLDELAARGIDTLAVRGLDRPWIGRFAARNLADDDTEPRPALLHALHGEVAESASAIAASWGVPLIRTVEDEPAAGHSPRLDPRGLAAVIVEDERLARELSARGHLPGGLLRVVAPGVEAPPAPAARIPGTGSVSGRVPVIGAMGRFGTGSGLETFLEAVRRVVDSGRDVEFLVAGIGPGEARLRRRAARLELADRLTFASPAALESAFWGVVDLYCHPSAVPAGTRPLIAAMAAGMPCVAAEIPGPRELLDGNSRGLLVPPNDPAALCRALLALLDRPALARSLAGRARSWALRQFDPDREAAALAALYARVAAGPPAP